MARNTESKDGARSSGINTERDTTSVNKDSHKTTSNSNTSPQPFTATDQSPTSDALAPSSPATSVASHETPAEGAGIAGWCDEVGRSSGSNAAPDERSPSPHTDSIWEPDWELFGEHEQEYEDDDEDVNIEERERGSPARTLVGSGNNWPFGWEDEEMADDADGDEEPHDGEMSGEDLDEEEMVPQSLPPTRTPSLGFDSPDPNSTEQSPFQRSSPARTASPWSDISYSSAWAPYGRGPEETGPSAPHTEAEGSSEPQQPEPEPEPSQDHDRDRFRRSASPSPESSNGPSTPQSPATNLDREIRGQFRGPTPPGEPGKQRYTLEDNYDGAADLRSQSPEVRRRNAGAAMGGREQNGDERTSS